MPLPLTLQSFSRLTSTSVISRLSSAEDGTEADRVSNTAFFGADGRYVFFESEATNLSPNDTTIEPSIFRKDLLTGAITSVSTKADGQQSNGGTWDGALSLDGRYLVFGSSAPDLVNGDNNLQDDIFWKDLKTGAVARVSIKADGTQANGGSDFGMLSADGRYVIFESDASNLIANDTNNTRDIFRKDMLTGELIRLSTGGGAVEANHGARNAQLSADGRFMIFTSLSDNLDPNDTDLDSDIYYKDLTTGAVSCLSVAANGLSGNSFSRDASLSANGRYVVFESKASDLVTNDINGFSDIYRKDLLTGETVLVSRSSTGEQGNAECYGASISADGRYVLFESRADNLAAGIAGGYSQIFRKDLVTGELILISAAANGTTGNDESYEARISADGRYVIFTSDSDVLVANDVRGASDIFLVDTAHIADGTAISENRYVEATFEVGNASSVSIAWGDGATSTVTPVNGLATLGHAYAAATGTHTAQVTVSSGGQSWRVAYTVDVGAATLTRNTALAATLTGGAANDVLTGDAFDNKIYGGAGNDTLRGDAGRDTFVFNTALSSSKNKDFIKDWDYRADTIALENAVFTALKTPGVLAKGAFVLGSKALQADDRVGYDKVTGNVWYDANGNKAGGYVAFTNIGANKKVFNTDFVVI